MKQALVAAALVALALLVCAHPARADLVAYWDFEDGSGTTATDVAAGHDGTLINMEAGDWITTGLAPTLTRSSAALDFDGVNEYVVATGYKGIGGTTPRTLSAWINTPAGGDLNRAILSWGVDSASQKWVFRTQNNNGQAGAIRVEVNGGYIVGETRVDDGTWHHVAAVLPAGATDVSQVILYVDGVNDGSSAVLAKPINTSTASQNLRIAQDHSNREFKGQMDDVAVWDQALSPHEISVLAAGVSPTVATTITQSIQNGLLANWSLDTTLGGGPLTTPDKTPSGLDGTLTGDAMLVGGKLENAMAFDGDNDYVDFGDVDIIDGLPAFSASLWFNRDVDRNDATNHGVDNVLIAQSSNAHNDNFELGTDGDNVEIYLDANTPDKTVNVAIPGGIADDVWHHILVTYDKNDGGLKLFFNGSAIQSWPEFVGNIDVSAASHLTLGMARPDASGAQRMWGDFDGMIDEVGIWDRALTTDEVAYLYNNGQANLCIFPEPATLTLLALGALALIRRRRTK